MLFHSPFGRCRCCSKCSPADNKNTLMSKACVHCWKCVVRQSCKACRGATCPCSDAVQMAYKQGTCICTWSKSTEVWRHESVKQINTLLVESVWCRDRDEATPASSVTENAQSFAVESHLIVIVGRVQCDPHRNRQQGHVGFCNWACEIVNA